MGNKKLLHIVLGENQINGGVARFTTALEGIGTLKEFPTGGLGNWYLLTTKTPEDVRATLGDIVNPGADLIIGRVDIGGAVLPPSMNAFFDQVKAA